MIEKLGITWEDESKIEMVELLIDIAINGYFASIEEQERAISVVEKALNATWEEVRAING